MVNDGVAMKFDLEEITGMVAFMRQHGIRHIRWGENELHLLEGDAPLAAESASPVDVDGTGEEPPNWEPDDAKRRPTLKKFAD